MAAIARLAAYPGYPDGSSSHCSSLSRSRSASEVLGGQEHRGALSRRL
ncbi:MAG: hypothetical protein M0Q43_08830 [Methanothrix sp.]|nr:hypothetical protein [Methanothrix sp.]